MDRPAVDIKAKHAEKLQARRRGVNPRPVQSREFTLKVVKGGSSSSTTNSARSSLSSSTNSLSPPAKLTPTEQPASNQDVHIKKIKSQKGGPEQLIANEKVASALDDNVKTPNSQQDAKDGTLPLSQPPASSREATKELKQRLPKTETPRNVILKSTKAPAPPMKDAEKNCNEVIDVSQPIDKKSIRSQDEVQVVKATEKANKLELVTEKGNSDRVSGGRSSRTFSLKAIKSSEVPSGARLAKLERKTQEENETKDRQSKAKKPTSPFPCTNVAEGKASSEESVLPQSSTSQQTLESNAKDTRTIEPVAHLPSSTKKRRSRKPESPIEQPNVDPAPATKTRRTSKAPNTSSTDETVNPHTPLAPASTTNASKTVVISEPVSHGVHVDDIEFEFQPNVKKRGRKKKAVVDEEKHGANKNDEKREGVVGVVEMSFELEAKATAQDANATDVFASVNVEGKENHVSLGQATPGKRRRGKRTHESHKEPPLEEFSDVVPSALPPAKRHHKEPASNSYIQLSAETRQDSSNVQLCDFCTQSGVVHYPSVKTKSQSVNLSIGDLSDLIYQTLYKQCVSLGIEEKIDVDGFQQDLRRRLDRQISRSK
ncbi:hypothetical protein HDV05_006101 [Chytridiales sp. JEL 0842]|nr:hypothetical protein HDV05_006101 [Chytridiales sp. JEL 0842]